MKQIILSVFLLFMFTIPGYSQSNNYWPKETKVTKPWTRWWWLGSAVDQKNISYLLENYSEKGLGGVEVAPIYGVKGEESRDVEFLSPQWTALFKHTIKEAKHQGMGVDLNSGTGWPFGGPHVTDEFAAKKLILDELEGTTQLEVDQYKIQIEKNEGEELIAMSAINVHGERINLLRKENKIEDIKNENRVVTSVIQKNTGQKVKRAAPGGEGLVFNHFSKSATTHYLKRFDEAFGKGKIGVRSIFNDSYELSSASASKDLFVLFEKEKGYDLSLYLNEFNGNGSDEIIGRIKADYREVLGTMLLQNFTSTWSKWAGTHGAKTRNQAHGSPGNLIDLYAEVGIPEVETFHATQFPFLEGFLKSSPARHTESNQLFKKFASSAAHLKGDKLVSCETFTWLNEHFNTPLYQCKPELDELFIKGVNHVFFQGTSYSPKDYPWPGWVFYASVHMEPSNPQWDHISAMNKYISRCQSILQSGTHTNDFLVYWSPAEYNHSAKGKEKKLTLHNSEQWVHMPKVDKLLEKGYQFDFVTDKVIDESSSKDQLIYTYDKSAYKAIVVPTLDRISLETFQNLLELANNGATIIFGNLPKKVTGFYKYIEQEKELASLIKNLKFSNLNHMQKAIYGKGEILVGDLEEGLQQSKIRRETLIDHHIKNISRKTEHGVYYFVANHEKNKLDAWLEFKYGRNSALFLNPLNGEITKAQSVSNKNSNKVRLSLASGASTIVFFPNESIIKVKKAKYYSKEKVVVKLDNHWQFKGIKGGPELPKSTMLEKPVFWTSLKGETVENFGGTAAYTTTFTMPKVKNRDYMLRFEDVEASAKIFINEKEVTTLWSFPFEVNVTKFLKKGNNSLRVEVANLGANRIRDLDKRGIYWKKFHNINIVNLRYKKLDASKWEVLPSGINGKVELIELLK